MSSVALTSRSEALKPIAQHRDGRILQFVVYACKQRQVSRKPALRQEAMFKEG